MSSDIKPVHARAWRTQINVAACTGRPVRELEGPVTCKNCRAILILRRIDEVLTRYGKTAVILDVVALGFDGEPRRPIAKLRELLQEFDAELATPIPYPDVTP